MEEQDKQKQYSKVENHGVTWIDVQSPSHQTLKELEDDYRLHPLHLQESIQKVQHSKVEHEEDYLFLVLHFPIYKDSNDKIAFGQIGIFLGKDYLITIRNGASTSINDLYNSSQDEEVASKYFKLGASYLLFVMIDKLLDEISAMTDDVVSQLDEIEDEVFDDISSDAQRIGKMRQKIVRLMRIIGPKRLILKDLSEQIGTFAGHDMTKYYSKNSKKVDRLWEVIGEAQETVEIYKDADFTTSTEQTNKTLAILTLIFTFTIPITVVGTLYGMNVPLPGGIQVGAWTFLGTYTTLIVLATLSLSMAVGMYVYFKNKRWF